MSNLIRSGNYIKVLGFCEYVIRHQSCPYGLVDKIDWALEDSKSSYRVVNGDTICPISSEEEAKVINLTFDALSNGLFEGAKAHLRLAAEQLSLGNWSDSIRESISCIESIAKNISKNSSDLGPALSALSKSGHIHNAMRLGFSNLYGYTSDEKGIRHALMDSSNSKAEEVDAIYMLGSCAAFASYLISKARSEQLLT